MRPGRAHTAAYNLVRFGLWGTFILLFVVLAQPLLPPSPSPLLKSLRNRLAENSNSLGTVLAALIAGLASLRQCIGEPWLWKTVTSILTEFQKSAFGGVRQGEASDNHRVTLYRFRRLHWPWCRGRSWYWPFRRGEWPWSGWLVPVVRAGPSSPATTVYKACDGNNFDGVCGAAFFAQQAILKLPQDSSNQLPDITANSLQADIDEYARRTWVSPSDVVARISANRPCARYFLAHRIEVKSERWGVVMVDTREAGLPRPQVGANELDQLKRILGHLVARS